MADLPNITNKSFIVYTGGEDGYVKQWVFDARNMQTKNKKIQNSLRSSYFSAKNIQLRKVFGSDDQSQFYKGHTAGITHVSITPPHVTSKERLVLTASKDMTAKVWKPSGKLICTLPNHGSQGPTPSISPHPPHPEGTWPFRHTDYVNMAQVNSYTRTIGRSHMIWSKLDTVLTCSDDGAAACWAARTGDLQTTLVKRTQGDHSSIGHKGPIPMATWSSDSKKVLTVSYDGCCILWDVAPGTDAVSRRVLDHGAAVWSGYWSSQDDFILTAALDHKSPEPHLLRGVVSLWNTRTGQEQSRWNKASAAPGDRHEGVIFGAQFNPNHPEQFMTHGVDGGIFLWDVRDPAPTSRFPRNLPASAPPVWTAHWGQDSIISASHDGTATVWNLKLGIMQHHLIGHRGPLWEASFSDNTTGGPHWAVTCSEDRTARVWQIGAASSSKHKLHSVMLGELGGTMHKDAVTCAVFMDSEQQRA